MDPEAFHEFEHASWSRVFQQYHGSFEAVTPQAAGPLLDAVGARAGSDVLDLATGPGYVAAAAAARGARVVALDFALGMVEQARRLHPGIDFQQGDAHALPCPDASFDAVTINFGLMHFAWPERALAEARRVLRIGGRIGFTIWAGPDRAIGFGIIQRAIERYGVPELAEPPGPPQGRFSEPDEAREALLGAGFTAPRTRTIPLVWRLPSPEALFEFMSRSTVRTAARIAAQTPEARAVIREAVAAEAGRYRVAAGEGAGSGVRSGSEARSRLGAEIELPMPALLAWAERRT